MSRELAIAMHCQRIVGSYANSEILCPCTSRADCRLTIYQRMNIEDENSPALVKAKERTKQEYQFLTDKRMETNETPTSQVSTKETK